MSDMNDTQAMIAQCATLIQKMADEFEEMAQDCEYNNSYGGCKKHPDGCTAWSCPLGGPKC
jgi:phage gp45-like